MLEPINDLISSVMSSPWAYLAIFLVSVIDAFFPPIPSDPVIIAAAAAGKNLLWVILLAAAGAFLGDHTSYTIGRFLGTPAARRLMRRRRGRAAHAWAQRMLRERGGLIIVALRFVPFGRMATTLTAGTLHYPLPRFAAFDALAVMCWAAYAALIGYFAGWLIQGNPLLALVVGIAISVAISMLVETTRSLIRWRRRARSGARGAALR